jgi:hypothetical protein
MWGYSKSRRDDWTAMENVTGAMSWRKATGSGLAALSLAIGWAYGAPRPANLKRLVQAAAQSPARSQAEEDKAVLAAAIGAKPREKWPAWHVLNESIDAQSVHKRILQAEAPGRERRGLGDLAEAARLKLSQDTLSDFEARNKERQKLPEFSADRKIVLLTRGEAIAISRIAAADRLRLPPPGAGVFYEFSLPGYSKDGSAALVYTARLVYLERDESEDLFPEYEWLLYLIRDDGRWHIHGTLFAVVHCY